MEEKKYKQITGEDFATLPSHELFRRLSENYDYYFDTDKMRWTWAFKGPGPAPTYDEIIRSAFEYNKKVSRNYNVGVIIFFTIVAAIIFAVIMLAV